MMKSFYLLLLIGMFGLIQAWAESQSAGNFTVNSVGSELGDLTVEGEIDVHGDLTLGTTVESSPSEGIAFQYRESAGAFYSVTLKAIRPETIFLWQDNGGAAVRDKMKLDGNNILSLMNSSGAATIFLNPNTGNLIFNSQGGGLVLSDGTVIRQASDLRSAALYDASGNAKVSLDGSGNLVFSAPATFQHPLKASGGVEFGPGVSLDMGDVTYLKNTLHNLGYGEIDSVDDRAMAVFGSSSRSISKLKYDSKGNTYVTGTFSGSAAFGSTTLTSEDGSDVFVAKVNEFGHVTWARRFGGPGEDLSGGIEVDSGGHIYVAGTFAETASFGGISLTSVGGSDDFVAKLNESGNVIWVKQFGGAGNDICCGIAVAGNGTGYITGGFSETATFGSTILTSVGGNDVFVAKLNAAGNVTWAKRFGGASDDSSAEIAIEGAGTVFISGTFSGATLFGKTNLVSAGSTDGFVIKLNASGNVTWAKRFGGTGDDTSSSLAVDGSGNTYLTGTFSSTIAFGGTNLMSTGGTDIYAVKISDSGNVTWSKHFGGTSDDMSKCIKVDAYGHPYIVGSFSGTANFAGMNLISAGGTDAYAIGMDESGNILSASRIGSESDDSGSGMAIAPEGRIAIALEAGRNFRIGDQMVIAGAGIYFWPGGEMPDSEAFEDQSDWGSGVNSASGAVALGQGATASGQASFAAGSSAASGDYSSSLGENTSATGVSSTSMGGMSFASGAYSLAIGINTSASGEVATASGLGTQAQAYLSTVMGRFNVGGFNDNHDGNSTNDGNTKWIESDPLIEIGNGTSATERSNVLTLFKNGKIRSSGVAEFKGGARIPPQGDLSMGEFTEGNNPADLNPLTGLKYTGE